MIRLATWTGLRSGEIEKLRLDELDFQRKSIRLADSKTGESVRPLNNYARFLLFPIRLHSQAHRVTGYVFPPDRGEGHYGGLPGAVVRIRTASYLAQETRDALREFSIHIARHLFATIANAVGVGEISLAALLGHSKGAVTAGYVSNMDPHLLKEANRAAGRVKSLMDTGASARSTVNLNDDDALELADDDDIADESNGIDWRKMLKG